MITFLTIILFDYGFPYCYKVRFLLYLKKLLILKKQIPLALNILKFKNYNFNYFSCEEAIFFEYLIVKGQSFKFKEFFHSTETISSETGIKKHSLSSIIKKFIDKKYISIEVKGMPKVKYFTVHYPDILNDLENIYRLEENGKPLYDFRKLLYDYFQPLAEKYKEKNINKNNNINNKENNNSSLDIGEEVKLLPSFNNFLFDLKSNYNLMPSQLKFSDFDFFNLCKNYDFEIVKKYLEKYFEDNRLAKLQNFFKSDKLASDKNTFIENSIKEEQLFIKSFKDSFQKTYEKRIEMYNDDKKNKRAKSHTTLAFTPRVIEKIPEAIKEYGEIGVKHAFIAYTDSVLNNIENPQKFLPYFFANPDGYFGVIAEYLDKFNMNYEHKKN